MMRFVGIILLALFVAIGLAWLVDNPGRLTLEWLGLQIQTSVLVGLVLVSVLMGVVFYGHRLWVAVKRQLPGLGDASKVRRADRGLDALAALQSDLVTGNVKSAEANLRRAERALPKGPLLSMMAARVAHEKGDMDAEKAALKLLLPNKSGRMFALRGLARIARMDGRREVTERLIQEIEMLDPSSAWAISARLELECANNNWSAALETLSRARKKKLWPREALDATEATLLFLVAREKDLSNAGTGARADLQRALKLAPDFTPAALRLADLHIARSDRRSAKSVLENAFKARPDRDVAAAFITLAGGDEDRVIAVQAAEKLVTMAPNSRLATLILAERQLSADDALNASETIGPLLGPDADRAVYDLALKIADAPEARDFAKRRESLLAGRVRARYHEPYRCEACGTSTDRWRSHCPACGIFNGLRPMPEGREIKQKTPKASQTQLLGIPHVEHDDLYEGGDDKKAQI